MQKNEKFHHQFKKPNIKSKPIQSEAHAIVGTKEH